tara:strand:+ start:25170 stop:26546 length:1377 start_codon:yes stop_codon:yes gene_type:complete
MASIGNDAGGRKRILFYAPDGSRKTIRLGKTSKSNAMTMKSRTEDLLTAAITGVMDRDLSFWVAELHPTLREKFVAVGLLESLEPEPVDEATVMTLDAFLTDFLHRKGPSKKPATRVVWGQVMALLREYMPDGILMRDVTVGHAKQFAESLRDRPLASSTVHKRVGFARQFFEDAVDWELIEKNPFSKVKTTQSSKKSNVHVPMETIDKVLRHCDETWSLIVMLSRIGGLRCPSETLSLKWGDVDFEHERMHVPECKVEHHEGRGVREVPLFGDLRPLLDDAFKTATVGGKYPSPDAYVIDKPAYRAAAMREGGWANANLRTQFLKILTRAKVKPWKRLFHSMRASRETDLLAEGWQKHIVCAWLGNTEAVADRHYNLVTDADFSQAARAARNPARSESKAARNPAPQSARSEHARNEKSPPKPVSNDVEHSKDGLESMEDNGLEPMTYALPARRSPN